MADDWRTSILKYLLDQELPTTPLEAKRLKTSAVRFLVIGRELYKRGYSALLLKCLGLEKQNMPWKKCIKGIMENTLVEVHWLERSYVLVSFSQP